MEEDYSKRGEACPQLLDLIPKDRKWGVTRDSGGGGINCNGFATVDEEKKLELRLGPPLVEEKPEEATSLLSLGYHPKASKPTKRGFSDTLESKTEGPKASGGRPEQQQGLERKPCCPPPAHAASGNAAGANKNTSDQARTTSAPVVGWPPVRSFRKNIASSSTKPSLVQENGSSSETVTTIDNCKKGLFVKINMDGIPIGRKVDLKAYDSYEKLSSAVEELFRGLLAARKDPLAAGAHVSEQGKQAFTTRLLDGSAEYTLVYEDIEGDKMLVGDVPWDVFISTAKRLRVLKSSELSSLPLEQSAGRGRRC